MTDTAVQALSPDEMNTLEILSEIGIRLVPEQPTAQMCKAGCAVGDIDPLTVQRIYSAMLIAAIDCRLHGDHSLN
jgi:hypothetical protein